ncbi:MAG: radical SAM protein [Nitrospinae bacterium]|nr:radical SAM protein [Nitrospinota bacterium]
MGINIKHTESAKELQREIFTTKDPGESNSSGLESTFDINKALENARKRMGKFFKGNQILGRKGAIGCVSLEISQRCNLDCSLCYLSESSAMVKDMPMEELYRRLDTILKTYGPGTNVQVSGGEPTLRDKQELLEIVRYARKIGLHPALFTNGIKCSRELLEELSQAGLSDVAFHVDLTQKRSGYKTENELNEIRQELIERARGLPLLVVFNTTVHESNFREIPDLIQFFIKNSDVVGMASFQLQADTGRGTLHQRPVPISLQSVQEKISKGAGNSLPWDTILVGHPKCHTYVPTFAVNGKAFGIIDDARIFSDFLQDFSHVTHDRREGPLKIAGTYLKNSIRKPKWILRALTYFLPRIWKIKKDILASKGRVNKISFFVQNFMDKDNLDSERIEACSFMVMTKEGSVSMCQHNASRDDYILQPIQISNGNESKTFYPLSKNRESESVSLETETLVN